MNISFSVLRKKITGFSYIAVVIVLSIVVLAGVLLYRLRSNPHPVIDVGIDPVFHTGFQKSGQRWPLNDEAEDLKNNPLVQLRKSYCERVGYRYAGGDSGQCFVFQYYDAYKTYTDPQEKFKVYYPTLWDLAESPVPFASNAHISLQRKGALCRLSYGIVDEKNIISVRGASVSYLGFGDYGYTPGGPGSAIALSQITIPFHRQMNDEERASGYTNTKLIAVPHFPYPSSPFGFVMTSGDEQPLLEACTDEFDSIVSSRFIDYAAGRLSDQSNGILALEDISSAFERVANDRGRSKNGLLFENASMRREELIGSDAFAELNQNTEPFLSHDKLYYLDGPSRDARIKVFDIVTGATSIIPLSYDPQKPVHSFFIRDSILYYLAGSFCNEYLTACGGMTLSRYDFVSGKIQRLATGSDSRDIIGLNAAGDVVLAYIDGDAGCSGGSYELYSSASHTLKKLGSFSHCVDDPEPQVSLGNETVGETDVNYLIVRNGKLFAPDNRLPSGGLYIRVNTSEYPLTH